MNEQIQDQARDAMKQAESDSGNLSDKYRAGILWEIACDVSQAAECYV